LWREEVSLPSCYVVFPIQPFYATLQSIIVISKKKAGSIDPAFPSPGKNHGFRNPMKPGLFLAFPPNPHQPYQPKAEKEHGGRFRDGGAFWDII
jgi:hypothetical protein